MILRLLHSIRVKRPAGEGWDEVHTITSDIGGISEVGGSGYWISHPPGGPHVTFVPYSNVRSFEQVRDTSPTSIEAPSDTASSPSTTTDSPKPGTRQRRRSPPPSGT